MSSKTDNTKTIIKTPTATQILLANIIIKIGDACWEWTGPKLGEGYGYMQAAAKKVYAHRYSYTLFVGPIPPGALLRHTCDNAACCNPAHLLPGTVKDNARDAAERNRKKKPYSIPEERIQELRTRYANRKETKVTQSKLAREYQINQSYLAQILRGTCRKQTPQEAQSCST